MILSKEENSEKQRREPFRTPIEKHFTMDENDISCHKVCISYR